MPPTILLDLDGALVDSLPGIEASGRAALAALGHPPDPALDIAAMIGPPIEEMMQLMLATSKRRVFAERILDHTGLATRFAAVHGSEPGGALDHKPELIAHILARHDLDAAACVMVGDRRHDIAGARANGMRGLGVLWGYGAREELEAAGADALVAAPHDLAAAALALVARTR